jgi:hypothetical protein
MEFRFKNYLVLPILFPYGWKSTVLGVALDFMNSDNTFP